MKRGSTRFWQCANAGPGAGGQLIAAVLLLAGMALPVISQAAGTQAAPAEKRANELTLSGLRPGRERLSVAQRKFDAAMDSNNSDEKGSAWAWRGRCKGWRISLEADGDGVIQTVDVSGPPQAGCKDLQSPERAQFWSTGRGLKLGDARERVVELYGTPNSGGPSVEGKRALELLYYSFDWAGSDVPQVMEVFCDQATGRVVEILLAYPGL